MRFGEAFIGGIFAFLLVSCITPERSVAVDTNPAMWMREVQLAYQNPHPQATEIRLFLRVDDRFRTDSLTVRITTLTPDSLRAEELHRLIIPARPTAAPLQRVVEVPYRRGVELRQQGTYRFDIAPVRPIKGVEAVGMKFIEQ